MLLHTSTTCIISQVVAWRFQLHEVKWKQTKNKILIVGAHNAECYRFQWTSVLPLIKTCTSQNSNIRSSVMYVKKKI